MNIAKALAPLTGMMKRTRLRMKRCAMLGLVPRSGTDQAQRWHDAAQFRAPSRYISEPFLWLPSPREPSLRPRSRVLDGAETEVTERLAGRDVPAVEVGPGGGGR